MSQKCTHCFTQTQTGATPSLLPHTTSPSLEDVAGVSSTLSLYSAHQQSVHVPRTRFIPRPVHFRSRHTRSSRAHVCTSTNGECQVAYTHVRGNQPCAIVVVEESGDVLYDIVQDKIIDHETSRTQFISHPTEEDHDDRIHWIVSLFTLTVL